jgi:ABC-type phosphate/phosphonate transport system substrate-binding protein
MRPALRNIPSAPEAATKQHSPSFRLAPRLFLAIFSLFLIAFGAPARAQEISPENRRAHLEILYSSSLFHTVSKNDAIASIRAWTVAISKQNGFQLDCNVSVAEDMGEIRRRLAQGPLGLVLLDPVEYFELEGTGLLEPAFTGTRGKEDESLQFVLVTREDSAPAAISSLRGKSLAIQSEYGADLGRMWIEVMLHDNGLGPSDRFFSSVTSVSAPSSAALPVFFGKLGAGVVDRDSFELMEEMNPQLGAKLRVLSMSPRLIRGILCMDRRPVPYREDLMQGLRELHQTPAGRQILMVFKSNRIKPVDPEDLERVRTLCTKYRLITREAVTAKWAAPGVTPAGRSSGGHTEVKP